MILMKRGMVVLEAQINDSIVGMSFYKWTVISKIRTKSKTLYKCVCSCDYKTERLISKYDLINGKTTHCSSCGTNKYIFKDDYILCETNKGEFFIIDYDDYDLIKGITWSISRGYVVARKNDKSLRLHRFIIESKCGKLKFEEYIDHINHNKLDNRKYNLKICSSSENKQNAKIYKTNTSGTAGVNWDKKRNMWRSRICINYKQIDLGFFEKLEDAILARNDAEKEYFTYKQEIGGIK